MSKDVYHPTTGTESVAEVQRATIYDWLGREFKPIEEKLDAEGKTELDGKLWALAGRLEEAGMWKALEQALGIQS